MIKHFLSFEKQISDLEGKIEELRHLSSGGNINIAEEIGKLQGAVSEELKSTYSQLSPWQKVQVSRHPERPHFEDIINYLFDDYTPLSGDRNFADDNALTGGTAFFKGKSVVVIGIDKGKNTNDRILKNFGMVRPEGYRKACRLMELAERFSLPIVTLVDTPGAYPGIDSEERGQSEAIAHNLRVMSSLKTPIIVNVVGEGGSGGALALGVGDHISMLEHSTYSVASPEACASIVWRDSTKADLAAEAMKLNAESVHDLGLIDEVIPEPLGGAHRSFDQASSNLSKVLIKNLDELTNMSIDSLLDRRYKRLMSYGSI